MKAKKWEIWMCDLGNGKGSEQEHVRPVLIIQNSIGNHYSPTTIIAVITTKEKPKLPTHVKIPAEIGIKQNSVILFEQLRTIDKSRLERKICNLPDEYKEDCKQALTISIFKE